MEGQIFDFL